MRVFQSVRERQRTFDALSLFIVIVLSAVPYVGQLGFYSDDWSRIAAFEAAAGSGHSAIMATLPDFEVRPVQGIYLGLLYDAFGLRPLGSHVVNTAVIAGSVVLLYLLLLRLRVSRVEAFAASLIFALLPQLSTVRVWFTAFQIPLSMFFALVAMHALLSSGGILWIAVAVASTFLSIGAYEIFAPMIGAFAATILFLQVHRERRSTVLRWRKSAGPVAVIAAVTVCTALKFLTPRQEVIIGPRGYPHMIQVFFSPHYDWRVDYGLNAFAAIEVHFWFTLRDWTYALLRLATGETGTLVTAMCIAIAAITWWRIGVSDEEQPKPHHSRLLLIGLAAFVLGHATFLISSAIMFANTGIGNRVLVAAAIGVAMILVGLAQFLLRIAPRQLRRILLASVIAIMAASAAARLEYVERYWAEAPRLEKQVTAAARADLGKVPAGTTVILDGVCPYHGPAIVFEADWDTGGAFRLALNRKIFADVVSPRMTLTRSGLDTSIYGFPSHHSYGSSLFVYSPRQHLLARLTDAAAARRYFSDTGRQRFRCPIGYVGVGVPI